MDRDMAVALDSNDQRWHSSHNWITVAFSRCCDATWRLHSVKGTTVGDAYWSHDGI